MATINPSEPNDSFSQATSFTLGDTIVSTLSSTSDQDYYKVVMTGSGVIKLDISSAELADWAYAVAVYDQAGTLLGSNYLGYIDSSSFSVAAASAGTYYIGVTASNIHSSSPYTLVTSAGSGSAADYEKEGNETQMAATAIAFDRVITGQQSNSADVDYFSLNADAAGNLIIDFRAPEKYGYSQYQISVYDAAGNLIDSRSTGGHMTLIEQVGSAGTYYVRVETSSDGTYEGKDYKFVAHMEPASALDGATALASGVAVGGSIAGVSEHDWYEVELQAGSLYQFSAAGSASGSGTLATPSLSVCAFDGRSLENCTNLRTYSDGSTLYTADPQIAFVAPYSGTYYLMVGGLGNTGSYTVQQSSTATADLIGSLLYSSGDAYRRWNTETADGTTTVTYAFMTSSSTALADGEVGFRAMTDSQKQAVRDVLAMYSAFAEIDFTEVANTSSAQITFGTSDQQGVSSGVCYSDWDGAGGLLTANVYISNTASGGGTPSSESLYKGGSGYETLIHEIGHALGLKHPGNYNAGTGSGTPPYISAVWDNTAYSLMSYVEDPEAQVGMQTPALLDIVATQYLYGTRNTSSGQTLSFSNTSEFQQSILAGSGGDTIDLGNQTGASLISLTPGTFSSIGLKSDGTAAHDNLTLAFSATINKAIGGAGNDFIIGNANNDTLSGGAGNDTIVVGGSSATLDGGAGSDTAVLWSSRGNFTLARTATGYAAIDHRASGGTVDLTAVESLRFSDQSLTLASDSSIGSSYAGGAADDVLEGGAGDDILSAGGGNDSLKPGAGNNFLDGGAGTDTAIFTGNRADYRLMRTAAGYSVVAKTESDKGDTLQNIEQFTFADSSLAVDYSDAVQQLYVAYFGRPADSGALANFSAALKSYAAPTDLQSLNTAYNSSVQVRSLIDAFGTSNESKALYTGDTTAFVNAIYLNVLNRAPAAGGLQFWVNSIDNGGLTRGNAALSIMAGALANDSPQGLLDAALVNNKIRAASNFTFAIDTAAEISGYSGNSAAATARSLLATVTSATDTEAFQATIESTLAGLASAGARAGNARLERTPAPELDDIPDGVVQLVGAAGGAMLWEAAGIV